MAFYADMALMVEDLMAPDEEGGLGQGLLQIGHKRNVRTGPNEWDPVDEVYEYETVRGAVRGVSKKMVEASPIGPNGPVILATDLSATVTPPVIPYEPGDVFLIDGKAVPVVQVTLVPPAGTTVAVRFILRG